MAEHDTLLELIPSLCCCTPCHSTTVPEAHSASHDVCVCVCVFVHNATSNAHTLLGFILGHTVPYMAVLGPYSVQQCLSASVPCCIVLMPCQVLRTQCEGNDRSSNGYTSVVLVQGVGAPTVEQVLSRSSYTPVNATANATANATVVTPVTAGLIPLPAARVDGIEGGKVTGVNTSSAYDVYLVGQDNNTIPNTMKTVSTDCGFYHGTCILWGCLMTVCSFPPSHSFQVLHYVQLSVPTNRCCVCSSVFGISALSSRCRFRLLQFHSYSKCALALGDFAECHHSKYCTPQFHSHCCRQLHSRQCYTDSGH